MGLVHYQQTICSLSQFLSKLSLTRSIRQYGNLSGRIVLMVIWDSSLCCQMTRFSLDKQVVSHMTFFLLQCCTEMLPAYFGQHWITLTFFPITSLIPSTLIITRKSFLFFVHTVIYLLTIYLFWLCPGKVRRAAMLELMYHPRPHQSVTPFLTIWQHVLFTHDTLCGARWEGVSKKRIWE